MNISRLEEPQNTIQELQDVLYEMLCTFDDYCVKHKIKYFLIAGTLLGAVRHNDFIPWDDDVDIGMTRSEYTKLLEAFKSDPLPNFFLQHYTTENNYLNLHAKLRKNGTYFEELENKFQKKIHEGIFLDIFPFDDVSNSQTLESAKLHCTRILSWIVSSKISYPRKTTITNILSTIIRRATSPIPSKLILQLIDQILKSSKQGSGTYLCYHLFGFKMHKKSIILHSEISKLSNKEIRNRKFPIPSNFHLILSRAYGNYMELPEENERKPKHAIKFNTNTPLNIA